MKKTVSHNIHAGAQKNHPIDDIVNYYSSWRKIKTCVAWLIKIINRLRHDQSTSVQLTVHDINVAEMVIVKHAQRTYYDKDLHEIQRTGRVSKSSSIYKL